jgi:hypothetical protein
LEDEKPHFLKIMYSNIHTEAKFTVGVRTRVKEKLRFAASWAFHLKKAAGTS